MPQPRDELFDVAVIGGGIQGAGVAQAAAAAGYRTLLVERAQWAAATSRWSSKLIHGGLRYLESGQLRLVQHSLRERQLLLRNAPALVQPVRFYIPIYRETRRRPWQIRIGLSLYALLSGLHPLGRFRAVPRSEWNTLGGLRRDGLQAVFQYWDGQTDDAALTRAVAASALQLGAHCCERTELLAAQREGDGFRLQLRTHSDEWTCSARTLVNATGPWINETLVRCGEPAQTLSFVKGSHIALPPQVLPGIFYLEAPTDGRAVFVMPWLGRTLVGTTEVEIDAPQSAPTEAEIDYLLNTATHYFPQFPRTVQDSFAGVRVLPAGGNNPFNRSRENLLLQNGALISLCGGKLTTYRHAAEQVTEMLSKLLGPRPARADTRTLPLEPTSNDAPK